MLRRPRMPATRLCPQSPEAPRPGSYWAPPTWEGQEGLRLLATSAWKPSNPGQVEEALGHCYLPLLLLWRQLRSVLRNTVAGPTAGFQALCGRPWDMGEPGVPRRQAPSSA